MSDIFQDVVHGRLDLKGGKMSMDETEDCLEQLSAGGWLRYRIRIQTGL